MPADPVAEFRALHLPRQPFILANIWDIGSARMMAALGARALATSSSAYGFTIGRPDMGQLSRDEALAHAQDIVAATALPVQGDFENGFGDAPETVAETVRLAAEAGLAGICIEDTVLPGDAPYPFDLAVDRIRAAADAAHALPRDFVLTARADGCLTGHYDHAEALRRIQAFDAAGACCLYVPRVATMAELAQICTATSKPVNVLSVGPMTVATLADFAAIGVARVSLGGGLARATHKIIHDAATAMFTDGDFSALSQILSAELTDQLLEKGAR
ncbi:isocitrate lyase/phosphoenolpyruvate mutase family protein [Actibacterium sp. 188UL27-1]|uniref:isocitrate lyase/PEP mutase family protein n=1 Tax=Actibacterium sp. 188UL27-1 TaxID=2786961 RepID=UPI00195D14A6|nr:isocitrate lyase/phosphoenolpyruvate mutase family protein [Actibacterium sp. 188UL27-1]MBM7067320.1 isocitrate lyase/phosphoenolpyruvate mutase family protein [Actibacterium sp. 188UL27-1]